MTKPEIANGPSDAVLIVWLILSTVWDFMVVGATGYLVFWKDHSGAWFILAFILCASPTLFKALRKRFAIEED